MGEAYCLNCNTDDPNTKCEIRMSAKEIKANLNLPPLSMKPEPPSAPPNQRERVIIPQEVEKEKIKRQLYNLIDRVDKL